MTNTAPVAAGLHLRDSALHPQLGTLLKGMLCPAAERGTDAAGIGVYGDPRLNPPGRATVCVLEAGPDLVRLPDLLARTDVRDVEAIVAGPRTAVTAVATSAALELAVRSRSQTRS